MSRQRQYTDADLREALRHLDADVVDDICTSDGPLLQNAGGVEGIDVWRFTADDVAALRRLACDDDY